jgi:membrane protease YdiL (CAAX protease family)
VYNRVVELPDTVPFAPPAEAPSAAVERRFCPRCGAPWEPAAASCRRCAMAASDRSLPAPPTPIPSTAHAAGLTSALLLYGALLAISAAGLVMAARGVDPQAVVLSIATAQGLVVAGFARAGWGILRPAVPGPVRLEHCLVALGAGCVTALVAWASVALMVHLWDVPTLDPTKFLHFRSQPPPLLLMAVLPAVVEETAFRGLILPQLAGLLEERNALLVSAMMFATLHLSPSSFGHLAFIGLVLGLLRLRTGSLLPPVTAHFAHNLIVLALGLA